MEGGTKGGRRAREAADKVLGANFDMPFSGAGSERQAADRARHRGGMCRSSFRGRSSTHSGRNGL